MNKNKLTENQKGILRIFIEQFLPKRGTKRKNSGNEMEYIGSALNLVFKKNFGFNLNRQNIIEAFEEMEYSIFAKKSDWDPELKRTNPSFDASSSSHFIAELFLVRRTIRIVLQIMPHI